jgi:hypothetical protein
VPLSVANDLAGDVLAVHVNGVTLQDTMARIGTACAAKWEPEGEGYRLIHDPTAFNADVEANRQARAKRIEAELTKLLTPPKKAAGADAEPLTPPNQETEAEVDVEGLEDIMSEAMGGMFGGGSKVVADLFRRIGPATLAQITPGSRFVLSSAPNGAQRALPNGWSAWSSNRVPRA